jgi:hypothetical protein
MQLLLTVAPSKCVCLVATILPRRRSVAPPLADASTPVHVHVQVLASASSSLVIDTSTITASKASTGDGGGVHLTTALGSSATFTGTTVQGAAQAGGGGGLYVLYPASIAANQVCVCQDCAGAIYLSSLAPACLLTRSVDKRCIVEPQVLPFAFLFTPATPPSLLAPECADNSVHLQCLHVLWILSAVWRVERVYAAQPNLEPHRSACRVCGCLQRLGTS